jgi:translation initiation factor 2 subunit 3
MSGIKNVIVLLNKLDLVKKSIAIDRYNKLCETLNKYEIEPKIIIPVCMNHKIGVDIVLKNIMKYMGPEYSNKRTEQIPLFMISRSFDVNHVNISYNDIIGGVIGGSLIGGSLKIGDEIEILPGIIGKNQDGTINYKPHYTKIVSLKSDTTELSEISAGGLIGIGTNIDPYYCKNDNMIGMIAGLKGTLPPVYYDITVKYNIIHFDEHTWNTFIGKQMIIIVGTNNIEGKINKIDETHINIKLHKPACISNDSIIVLCDKTHNSFHIVSYGYLDNHKFEVLNKVVSNVIDETTLSDDSIDIDDI